uniref:Uncharacterized protein n=1 Tax=Brassica oleracea var. oleracea TaxID=109376 RepID=A0A0D3CC23_BRAOL
MGDQIMARYTDFMINESVYPTLKGESYKLDPRTREYDLKTSKERLYKAS